MMPMGTEAAAGTAGAHAWAGARLNARVLALAVMLVGVLTTWALTLWIARSEAAFTDAAFERASLRIENDVRQRFESALKGLRSGAAAMAASEADGSRFGLPQFRAFVQASRLSEDFPGLRGFGFIERVPQAELQAFVARRRAEDASDFAVHRLGAAAPDESYVVKYIEPLAQNAAALGLDVASEQRRRDALERAIVTGQPTMTPPILLAQDGRPMPGLLLLQPVFRGTEDGMGVPERRRSVRGFLYAPLVLREFLNGVEDAAQGLLQVELLTDADGSGRDEQVYASSEEPSGAGPDATWAVAGSLQATRTLGLVGRAFTLRLRSTARFDAASNHVATTYAPLVGVLLSAFLAWLTYLTASGRQRAERVAAGMTVELARLAMVARRTSNAVVITDLQRRITWVNAGFERTTGYTLEEVRGRVPGSVLQVPETDAATVARLRDALNAGQPFRGELLNAAKDGRRYWVDVEIQTIVDEEGQAVGFMAIETDITDKRNADRALATSQALLERTGRLGAVGGWHYEPHSGHVLWSDQTCRIHERPLGHQPTLEEAVGHFAPASRPLVAHALREAVDRGQSFDLELQIVTASGRLIWVRSVGEVEWVDGRAVRLIGTLQDITARHTLQEEMRRRTEVLTSIVHSLPCGLSVFDDKLQLVTSNLEYRRLLDFPDHLFEPAAPSFESFIRFNAARGEYGQGDVESEVKAIMERAWSPASTHQFERVRPNGTVLDVRGAPMPGGGFVTTYTDISAIREVTRQLELRTAQAEQASVAKGQFLANMSHEIRTPMNAILGMLALLQKTQLTLRQADYAAKAEGATRALLNLINDILDFSKIDADKMQLERAPFRLQQLVTDLSVILSSNAGAKPLEVLLDVDPGLPPALLGDATRLMQVLVNLGGNAIKFTTQGEVVVALALVERRATSVLLEVSVRDTGIGIAPENQAHIFTGFSQAEASTTRRFGGTGLGLAISQRLVGLMGGQLAVQSRLGEGTRFHFRIELPLCELADCPPWLDTFSGAEDSRRVLLVDDHGAARDALRRAAQSLHWQVEMAEDGAQALVLFQQAAACDQAFDAVLVDWRMPGLDGWETVRRLRATPAGWATPLVLMLGGGDLAALEQRSPEEQALLSGHLVKPVTASMLLMSLCEAGARVPAPTGGAGRLAGLRLLLAEDNANNQQVARELLQDEGATVHIANDGQEAVAALQRAPHGFDLVLMDLQMPVMDGFTATRLMRAQPGQALLPIVAMTANALASDRQACLDAGMNDHVGKPFDLQQLVQVINRWTGRPSQAVAVEPPMPATPGADSPWQQAAEAAGIGLATALTRMGGRADIYQRLLRNFADELAPLAETLHRLVAQQDWPTLARTCHTLRGTAGTLGIGGLARQFGAVEMLLGGAAPPSPSGVAAAVQDTARLVSVVHDQLAGLLGLAAAAVPLLADGAAPDWAWLQTQLQRLDHLLGQSDMAALQVVEAIEQRCGTTLGPALADLVQAASALDFEGARGHGRRLLAGVATAQADALAGLPAGA